MQPKYNKGGGVLLKEVLDALTKQDPIMEKAVKKLVYISADDLVRYEMEMREKAERDYRSAMMDSRDEGIELSTVIMIDLKNNVPLEEIATNYNVSINRIKQIQSIMNS